MPALVFPAPGCSDGQQFITPFMGFDLAYDNGASYKNLLTNSTNLSAPEWIRGVNGVAVLGSDPYNTVNWYLDDEDILSYRDFYVLKLGTSEYTISSISSTQYFGQQINVESNTTHTFSFYAKRGTATETTYKVYDQTNSEDIITATSYYTSINAATWTRVVVTFTTPIDCQSIIVYPLWNIATGSPGTVNVFGLQVEQGNTASAYEPTFDVSFAATGFSTVAKRNYNIDSRLATFSEPAKNFEDIAILGQTSATWKTVDDYIFDNPTLTYTASQPTNKLTISEILTRPYLPGDTVTISNASANYRENFQVTAFTTTSITINTAGIVPLGGSLIVNPNPQLYPKQLVFDPINLNKVVNGETYGPKENLFVTTYTPNFRGVEYFLDRNFTLSDQRATDYGLVTSNGYKIKGVEDNRSAGKVLPRSNITTIDDKRTVGNTDTFSVTNNTLLARLPGGVLSVTGMSVNTYGPYPLSFTNAPKVNFYDSLSPYLNIGITEGPETNVTGQDNITFNLLEEYIYDLNFITASTFNTGATQTIYYNPIVLDPDRIIKNIEFTPGYYVKILDSDTGFSAVVQVISATSNSITFDAVPGFPTDRIGGMTVQSASTFVYPQSKTDDEMYSFVSTNGIFLGSYSFEPRENYSLSEFLTPNYRSLVYKIDNRDVQDRLPLINTTQSRLEVFTDTQVPGDFRTYITGQTDDQSYATVLEYIYDQSILTYTTVILTEKTLYFPTKDVTAFATGSVVRVVNETANYDVVHPIVGSTTSSITITGELTNFPDSSNTYIESTTASVYPQSYVTTNVAPVNARENFYYFNLAPGIRSNRTITYGNSFTGNDSAVTIETLRSTQVLKTITSKINTERLSTASQLISTKPLDSVTTLQKNLLILKEDNHTIAANPISVYYDQREVRPLASPINARENFYYFNIAPGYRSNKTIVNGQIIDNNTIELTQGNLNKQLLIIKAGDVNLTVAKVSPGLVVKESGIINNTSGKMSSSVVLATDAIEYPFDFIEKLIVSATEIQQNPLTSFLDKQLTRLVDNSYGLEIDFIEKLIVTATEIFETPYFAKTDSTTKLTSDNVTYSTESLEKQLAKLTSDNATYSTELLSNITTLRSDTATYSIEFLNKQLTKLIDNSYGLDIEFLNKQLTRLIDNSYGLDIEFVEKLTVDATEIFEAPYFAKLDAITKLKSDPAQLTVDQLKTMAALKSTAEIKLNDAIEKLTVTNTEVQKNPVSSFLINAAVLRAEPAKINSDKIAASTKLRDIAKLDWLGTSDLGNYYDQRSVVTTVAPTNARERFYYFTVAPGYQYNRSIQQGNVFEIDRTLVKPDQLETLIQQSSVRTTIAPINPRETLYYSTIAKGKQYGTLYSVFGSTLAEDTPIVDSAASGTLEKDSYKFTMFTVDSAGLLVRLKTGDFKSGSNGIADVAAPKKEPVQFWN